MGDVGPCWKARTVNERKALDMAYRVAIEDGAALPIIADGILAKQMLFGNLRGAAFELSRRTVIDVLRDGLDALAAEGYSVVKTDALRLLEHDYILELVRAGKA